MVARWSLALRNSHNLTGKSTSGRLGVGLSMVFYFAINLAMEHHVYFWLKEDRQNDNDRLFFEKGIEALLLSPNVASGHWGKPAATAERTVTDHSFDYAISLKFDSIESHNSYQERDLIHDEFISGFKEWWSKVLVMDLA